MSPELITNIIIAAVGFILVKYFSSIDKNVGKVGDLTVAIEKLGGIIQGVEREMITRQGGTDAMLKEHHDAIEITRKNLHEKVTEITAILSSLQLGAEINARSTNDIIEVVNAIKDGDKEKLLKFGNIRPLKTILSERILDK